MSASVKFFDAASGKSIGDTSMPVIPRIGEIIFYEGTAYVVDGVEYERTAIAWVVYIYLVLSEEDDSQIYP